MATIIGIILAVILFGIALYNKGISAFFDLDSIIIVLGGILSSIFIAFPLERIFSSIFYSFNIFKQKKISDNLIIDILRCSILTRKESFLALDNILDDIENEFLKKGLILILEGYSPENVKEILESDLENYYERLQKYEAFFRFISKLAPAFGMIGTLIGLIAMLRNLTNATPKALGPAMATALITTFYGAMIAFLISTPVAEKISEHIDTEILEYKIVIEGVLMIYGGINPRIIEKKLSSYLPENQRIDFYSIARESFKK